MPSGNIDQKMALSGLLSLHRNIQRFPLELEKVDSDENLLVSNNYQQTSKHSQLGSCFATNPANSKSNTTRETNSRTDRYGEKKIGSVYAHHFLTVLMNLLNDGIHKDKLSFLPDGNLFIINRISFSCSLMLRYFNISNFAVFTRTLKRLGFIQVKQHALPDLSDNYFLLYHPLFCKGDQEVVHTETNQCHYFPKIPIRNRASKALFRHDQSSKNLYNVPNRIYSSNQERKLRTQCDDAHSVSDGSLYYTRMTKFSRSAFLQDRGRRYVNSLTKKHTGDMRHTQNLCHNAKSKNANTSLSQFEEWRKIQDLTNDTVAAGIQCLLHDEDHTLDLLARRGHEIKSVQTAIM